MLGIIWVFTVKYKMELLQMKTIRFDEKFGQWPLRDKAKETALL